MLPCLTFHMTHTWLRIIPSPTRTQRIFGITKVYGEIQQQKKKKYWNPYFHGLSFWVATCTGFCATLFSNAIPVQGNTPRRENRHHCSVSMVFMVHTPRCFWSISARDRNKVERFQRLSCLLVIPTPSLALQTVQHKVESLGRHSLVATFSMFLASSSSESSIVSLL